MIDLYHDVNPRADTKPSPRMYASVMRELSLLGVLLFTACSGGVGRDRADGGDTGGSGGSVGGSGGSGVGGFTPSGGSGGSGLTGGSGATDGGISCDSVGSLLATCQLDPNNPCLSCIAEKCCDEYSKCGSRLPQASCGWGGPHGEGEIVCIQDCVLDVGADGGVADDETIATCAGGCTTPGCDTLSPHTSELLACLKSLCFEECLQQ